MCQTCSFHEESRTRDLKFALDGYIHNRKGKEANILHPLAQNQGQGKTKTPSASSLWDLMGPEGEGDWGLGAGGGEGGLQSWGSLASLFRPQTCSTLKIGDDKGNKKEGAGGGSGGGAGGAGGGKFLQNLLNPAKKSVSFCILPFLNLTFSHLSYFL